MLNAFVAEYKVEYGAGFCPKNDDKFIIADLCYFNFGNKAKVNAAIDEQLIFIKSIIY